MRSILHVFTTVLVVCFLALPTYSGGDPSWPQSRCESERPWLVFAEMSFCISKDQVISVTQLNLSAPSMSLRFVGPQGREQELGVSRLDDRQTTGGLHERLGVKAKEIFDLVVNAATPPDRLALIRKVLDIDETSTVRHYRKGHLDAYGILRMKSDSSVYVFSDRRSGAIQISGNLDGNGMEYLLSAIDW